MLHGRSCLKDGWWSGGMEVQVNGQNALIKRYEGAKDQAARVSKISLCHKCIDVSPRTGLEM